MTTDTLTDKQAYLDAYAAGETQEVAPLLRRLRQAGIAAFDQLGFPGRRDEDWKFTNLAPLLGREFMMPPPDSDEGAAAFRDKLTHEGEGVTFLAPNANRPFALRGSRPLPNGVILCSLAGAIEQHAGLVEPHLGRLADHRHLPFVALNSAFLTDGAFLYVPPGVVVDQPIELSSLVAAYSEVNPYVWHRRTLVVVGAGARVTFYERFFGLPIEYLTTSVTEIVIGDAANVEHYKVQEESANAFHLATTAVHLDRASRFSTHYFGFGAALSRHEVRVRFNGENAEATVNGLYHANDSQHMDNHTVLDHAQPHCASHELYKGVLDGKSRGVFTGKIFVRKDAQKTDAKQTNKTLLLSDDAMIDTRPQLEIFADDVKCTHGATVGQLDEQQLFYLRARGISLEQARVLLTFAFANDIIERVRVPALRRQLQERLLEAHHLPTTEDV